MKVTKKSIKRVPIFILDSEDGTIYKGSIGKKDNKYIPIINNTDVDNLYFPEELSFKDIDTAFLNKNQINLHLHYITCLCIKDGNMLRGGDRIKIFIFSSIHKANNILKNIFLPRLLKLNTDKANNLMQSYMNTIQQLDDLETKFKALK